MKNFIAGTYKQQGGYKSFTPFSVNRYIAWENPQIDVLLEHAGRLLGNSTPMQILYRMSIFSSK